MGHTEKRLMAELATLNEAEKARLLAYVERLKGERLVGAVHGLAAERAREREALAAELAPFRVALAGYNFDRAEANAR